MSIIMEDENKYSNICRVCLSSQKEKSMSLFKQFKNSLVSDYINLIANVEIKKGDGLPDIICSTCFLDLETAVNFKEKCENANVILHTSLKENLSDKQNVKSIKDIVIKKEEPQEVDIELSISGDEFHLIKVEKINNSDDESHLIEKENVRKTRAIDLRLECNDCGNFFKSKCKLRVHWKNVHLPQTLICDICKRCFKSIKAFSRHKNTRTQSCITAGKVRIEGEGKSRVFWCKECDYKSVRTKDMKTHLVTHTGERPFQCDICSATYTQQCTLDCHKEIAHKLVKCEVTCHYCGKHVKGRRRIYRHFKMHKNNEVQCDVCRKTLKDKKCLKVHMQRHSGVRNFTCEKCARAFFTQAELCTHNRLTHMKDKFSYKCNTCDYKSPRKESVRKHQVKHTDNNIPCTVCGMFFESSVKLVLHEKKHFAERNFGCSYCQKKFYKMDTLRKHIRKVHKHIVPSTIQNSTNVTIKKENQSDIYCTVSLDEN